MTTKKKPTFYDVRGVRRSKNGYRAKLYAGGVNNGNLFRIGTKKECEDYWQHMTKRMNEVYTKQIGWRNPFSDRAEV